MIRKRIISVTACFLVLALSLTACSKSKSDDESSKKESSKKSGKSVKSSNGKSGFVNDVTDACNSLDQSVFDDVESDLSTADPDQFVDSLQAAEDELDQLISEFEDIDAPSQFEDDWDTFLDDFSAIRDAFPELATAMQDIVEITLELETSTDPAAAENAQAELLEIQSSIEALTDDLTYRTDEIEEISDRLGITDACDLD